MPACNISLNQDWWPWFRLPFYTTHISYFLMTCQFWPLFALFAIACSCSPKTSDPESIFILSSFNHKHLFSLAYSSVLFRNWRCNPFFFQLRILLFLFASFESPYISFLLSFVPLAVGNSSASLLPTYKTNPELDFATASSTFSKSRHPTFLSK